MSDNGQQVPLIERLRRVPAAARVLEHTPNPLGYDTTSIPVGALCREAADRIAELEAALAAERERREAAEAELAAERKRRASAEWALKEIRVRLHAAGRRPEECWEMSEIDGHLAQFGRHKD